MILSIGISFACAISVAQDLEGPRSRQSEACDRGNADACMLLGRDFGFGESGPIDELASRDAYAKACELGVATGCHLWGSALFFGVGGETDKTKARELQARACAANDKGGCFLAGVMWGGGHGGEQSSSRARDYFEKACELGHTEGCKQLSWLGDTWLLVALAGSLVIGLVLAAVCLRKRGPGPGAFVGSLIPLVALNIMAFAIDALRFVWFPLLVGAASGLGGYLGTKLLFKGSRRSESARQPGEHESDAGVR